MSVWTELNKIKNKADERKPEIAKMAYGAMYTNSTIAVTLTVQNTWYEIDAAQVWTTGELYLCTFADPKITVTRAGKYLINWAMSCNIGTANQGIMGGIMRDSTTVLNQGRSRMYFLNSSRNLIMSSTAIIPLTANQTVSLAARNITSGARVLNVIIGNLTLVKIGE